MYTYVKPKPLVFELVGDEGFKLRKEAKKFIEETLAKGPEAGSPEEQSYGILAQLVIRKKLNLPAVNEEKQNLGVDIVLPSGVRVDVKCRGGVLPFQEEYVGTGDIIREAKHNFFARQVWDSRLETDIYLMTHLEVPQRGKLKAQLPGTLRQRKWKLYVCGWVSKARVQQESVYLPRGSLTEQGRTWFTYRGQEIEFYHKYLNGLRDLKDLLGIDQNDVEKDVAKPTNLHLTSPDTARIAIDLVGRGILSEDTLKFIKEKFGLDNSAPPILHPNQYFHFVRWLELMGKANNQDLEKLQKIMSEEKFTGL